MTRPQNRPAFGSAKFPDARDLSEYLVHLTKSEEDLANILLTGRLEARNPFGLGRHVPQVRSNHHSACLTEAPLPELTRVAKKKGSWGIAFRHDFIKQVGGHRVWYLDEGSLGHRQATATLESLKRSAEWAHPFWNLTPFIDRVIPGIYDFPHEREWRVPGGFHFNWEDVAVLIIPSGEVMSFEFEPMLANIIHNGRDMSYEWWGGTLPGLNKRMEEMRDTFLERYVNPEDHLFHGAEDEHGFGWGGYSAVQTEDGVNDLFGDILPSVRDILVNHLNGVCPVWLSQAELDEDAEDYRRQSQGDVPDSRTCASTESSTKFGFNL
jgi:hypothetical protein